MDTGLKNVKFKVFDILFKSTNSNFLNSSKCSKIRKIRSIITDKKYDDKNGELRMKIENGKILYQKVKFSQLESINIQEDYHAHYTQNTFQQIFIKNNNN